jgi:hypothetical protein
LALCAGFERRAAALRPNAKKKANEDHAIARDKKRRFFPAADERTTTMHNINIAILQSGEVT